VLIIDIMFRGLTTESKYYETKEKYQTIMQIRRYISQRSKQ